MSSMNGKRKQFVHDMIHQGEAVCILLASSSSALDTGSVISLSRTGIFNESEIESQSP